MIGAWSLVGHSSFPGAHEILARGNRTAQEWNLGGVRGDGATAGVLWKTRGAGHLAQGTGGGTDIRGADNAM